MKRLSHIVVLDPISFAGGSKVSTKHILNQLDDKAARVTILTADPQTWSKTSHYVKRLFMPRWLEKAEQGKLYFLRHALIALQLLWLRLFVGKMDVALAASGPGVDLGLYIAKPLLGYQLIQMIHGPVARSRTIGRCLMHANRVYYLESTLDSLDQALNAASSTREASAYWHFKTFRNGLPRETWPSRCQYDTASVFWAASLLKWKGLDVLTDALSRFSTSQRPQTHVCFIRPKQINLPVSDAPQAITKVFWHQEPENLDAIRSSANIFVSTSTKEPFGLSILEAMAAGMCVLIPADGAFWDTRLTHGENCLKYQADDAEDLKRVLALAQGDMRNLKKIGATAYQLARQYRAEYCFASICSALIQKNHDEIRALNGDEAQG